jgi:hypothetical protein
VRVIVDAKKAEAEMTFPGEIKVTVLREVRAEATARRFLHETRFNGLPHSVQTRLVPIG